MGVSQQKQPIFPDFTRRGLVTQVRSLKYKGMSVRWALRGSLLPSLKRKEKKKDQEPHLLLVTDRLWS